MNSAVRPFSTISFVNPRYLRMRFLSLLVILLFLLPARTSAAGKGDTAQLLDRARAVLVVEEEHGSTLVAKSPSLELPIASLTKLLTALVFLETHPIWEREITVKLTDIVGPGKKVLLAGDRVTLVNLFTLMLVRSDNTAATAIGRESGMSKDEFVAAMNRKAESMGLAHTAVVEPTGLDGKNRSTALDLVRLSNVAFQNPYIAAALERPSFTLTFLKKAVHGSRKLVKKRIASTNLLLGETFKGLRVGLGKTGTSDEAGYSYVLRAQTLEGRPRFVLAVFLATPSQRDRFALAADVLSFAALQMDYLQRDQTTPSTVVKSVAAD